MTNKERLLALADIVEKGHHKFNGVHAALVMNEWLDLTKNPGSIQNEIDGYEREDLQVPDIHNCNTIACIAGFTCLLFDYAEASRTDENKPAYDVESKARSLLELSGRDACDLFHGRINAGVTGPNAAKVIRNFAETGEVDWDAVVGDQNNDY